MLLLSVPLLLGYLASSGLAQNVATEGATVTAKTGFDKRSCLLRPDPGSAACRLSTKLFYFDAFSRTCRVFTYRGCGGAGNANRFQSWEECMAACTGRQSPLVNSFTQFNPLNPFAVQARTLNRQSTIAPSLLVPNPKQNLLKPNNGSELTNIFNQRQQLQSFYQQGLAKYQATMRRYFPQFFGQSGAGAGEGEEAASKQTTEPDAPTCPDLVLNAVLGRRQAERYTHEYSATLPNSRHPPGSTVSLRCTENAAEATTYAYDDQNELVDSGRVLTAVCDANAATWLLNARPFKKVYCSRLAQEKPLIQGCRNILLYQRFSIQPSEAYAYDYQQSDPATGLHPHDSTVSVTCKEAGQDASIYAYDDDSAFITKAHTLQARCNQSSDAWTVDGRTVFQAYCTRHANTTDGDDNTCVHFNPTLFPHRRGFEYYDLQYSDTLGNRWHPANSTVLIRCTNGGLNGRVSAFDVAGNKVEEAFVQIGTCDGDKRQWMIGGSETPFARVFCSPGGFSTFNAPNSANSWSFSNGLLGSSLSARPSSLSSANRQGVSATGGGSRFGGNQFGGSQLGGFRGAQFGRSGGSGLFGSGSNLFGGRGRSTAGRRSSFRGSNFGLG